MRAVRYDFLLLTLLTAFCFSSCVTYEQSVILQEAEAGVYEYNSPTNTYKIRANDLLNVSVKSLESSNSEFVNPLSNQNAQVGQQGTGNPQLLFNGYRIDEAGRIDVPLIGNVQVLGLTLDEVEMILEEKLKPYSKYSNVRVNLSNFRITVMGEVNRSGVQYVYERDYNVLQAISNAGDLTDFANIAKVKVLRRDGKQMKSAWLDLTSPEVVASEYYHLQPDDFIYVEPLKVKVNRDNARSISLGVSVVSLAVTLITLFSR